MTGSLNNESYEPAIDGDKLHEQVLIRLAGPHLPQILDSKESACQFLGSTNADLRQVALYVLSSKFGFCDEGDMKTLKSIEEHDPSAEIRWCAKLTLIECLLNSGHKKLATDRLIDVVCDENDSEDARVFCYNYLIGVANLDLVLAQNIAEIDWEMVSHHHTKKKNEN